MIFVSPHLDDVTFSCAGLISRLRRKRLGVQCISVFTEGEADCSGRRREDEAAASFLDIESLHLGFIDAPFRIPRPQNLIFGTPSNALSDEIAAHFRTVFKTCDLIYAPLGVGWHVDHLTVFRAATEAAVAVRKPIYYYAEKPYSLIPGQTELRLGDHNALNKFVDHWFKATYVRKFLSGWSRDYVSRKAALQAPVGRLVEDSISLTPEERLLAKKAAGIFESQYSNFFGETELESGFDAERYFR